MYIQDMKIVIAPDKFKGSLSAPEVCKAIKTGLLSVNKSLTIDCCPLADGGDGSLALLNGYLSLNRHTVETSDPLGRPINASYYTDQDTAYIELASASGYVLLNKQDKNPLYTSTYGTGIMIKDAVERGYTNVALFLGGSATNDAGIGILNALGFSLIDKAGQQLEPIGKNLKEIVSVLPPANSDIRVSLRLTLLCDVDNPLHGPDGAAYVYAPQKGARPEDVMALDEGLKSFAKRIKQHTGQRVDNMRGAGAAGGIPAGLSAFLNCRLVSGSEMFIELSGLENRIKDSDIVITGEGLFDNQSISGKLPGKVIALANKYKKRYMLFAGDVKLDNCHIPADRLFTVRSQSTDLNDAMTNASAYLTRLARSLAESL